MAFYRIPQLRYWFPSRFLVGLCNTPLIVIIYVINPKAFSGYLERGIVLSLHPFGHEQYPFDNVGQNELAHGVIHSNPIQICYPFRFWFGLCNTLHNVKIWLIGPKAVFWILEKGYCMFLDYTMLGITVELYLCK